MDKSMLTKMILFFALSFIIILTVTTLMVGIINSGTDVAEKQKVASTSKELNKKDQPSTTASLGEGEEQKQKSPADSRSERVSLKVVDSLKKVLVSVKTENNKLKKELEQISKLNNEQKTTDETAIKRTKNVAKIYEKMDPEEAAKILTGLNTKEVANIITFMRQRQAAKILEAMEPKTAMVISKKLASLN